MVSKVRIASGIVLFLFVVGHLINLAFGLNSLEAMEAARPILMGVWSNPVGGMVLLTAFVAHAGLGLYSLYMRNTLLMNWRDGGQALLGLAILPLLLPHIMGVGIGPALTGMQPTFQWVLAVYWLFAPTLGIQQVLALIVVWVHGCYGLLLWLQIQERVGWTTGLLWPMVVFIPLAALLGFLEAAKTLFRNREDPEFMAPIQELSAQYDPIAEQLWSIHDTVLIIYVLVVAAVLIARFFRIKRSGSEVTVIYGENRAMRRQEGLSLLEMAREAGLSHAALCGARGRCGSCAVRILEGADRLSPPQAMEQASLARTAADPDMRLACQAKPLSGTIRVEQVYDPLVLPGEYRAAVNARRNPASTPPTTSEPDPNTVAGADDFLEIRA